MEESEEYIESTIQSIKEEYEKAKLKADFDVILKKYNIKMIFIMGNIIQIG